MTSLPTPFETQIVHAILEQHRERYPDLIPLCANLRVESRKSTSVGAYITFSAESQHPTTGTRDAQIGFDGEIRVTGIPSGLAGELVISDGLLDYLELVTYGDESWDGSTTQGEVVVSKR